MIKTITLIMTGASGAQYGLSLLKNLISANRRVYLLISKPARIVLKMESEINLPVHNQATEKTLSTYFNAAEGQLSVFGLQQWMAPIASGSGVADATIVCPCTTGTLAAIAQGHSKNLIERAADVALKERKKLILVVRETPFSEIHLENMLCLSRMGAIIMPANPGFYHQPKGIDDLINFMVARILDQLAISHQLLPIWGAKKDKKFVS